MIKSNSNNGSDNSYTSIEATKAKRYIDFGNRITCIELPQMNGHWLRIGTKT